MEDWQKYFVFSILVGILCMSLLAFGWIVFTWAIKQIIIRFAFPYKYTLAKYGTFIYHDDRYKCTRTPTAFFIELPCINSQDTIIYCHGNGNAAKEQAIDWVNFWVHSC